MIIRLPKPTGAFAGARRGRARPMSRASAKIRSDGTMAKPVRTDLLPLLAEVFRAHGYDGATLALISEATGLGKGSLYHFFPGGKAQMASEVLAEIDSWFERNIFAPLCSSDNPV